MDTTQNDKDLARLMQIAETLKKITNEGISSYHVFKINETFKIVDDWILELCSPAAKLNAAISVKSPEAIQIAHDICVGVLQKEVPLDYATPILRNIQECASVLCWVLNHKHANSFADNLKMIEDDARRKGYGIKFGK